MFKVNRINGDQIETTNNASTVLGQSCHEAMKWYFGGGDTPTPTDEGEATLLAHDKGLLYLTNYSDGMVKWSKNIADRAKLNEKYAFAFYGYLKEFDFAKHIKEVLIVEKSITHTVEIDGKLLPVPLTALSDLVYRGHDDKIRIIDHKFTSKYSDPEAIDGAKLIQAAFNYFTVYAELGEAPYSMIFREFKTTKNQDKSPQTKEIEIVFDETPLLFEFFYRLYEDITDALMGKQVYIPNIQAMYDKEVAILSYIHRLDIDEERAKAFHSMQVDNITDFLKKRIERDGSMKKYLETVTEKFISAGTLNYSTMTTQEKIKAKMAEHGIGLNFENSTVGSAVTLYRFEASVGVKMTKLESYVKDIEQVTSTAGVRILAPIPNSDLVGFEIPNEVRTFPSGLPTSSGFDLAIGVDIMGATVRMDIREAPHVLVAGATGAGKSVFLNTLIEQLASIPKAEMILIDPKMVELSRYAGVAKSYHSDVEDINMALAMLVGEMDRRYEMLQAKGARNLKEYHAKGGRLPYIFVIIDEYGDLVVRGVAKTIKTSILLLAQKARAAGIHLVLTTQRPSVNIVDGVIKANFPTRIAFRTASSTDSHVIFDQSGAEKLLGKGDMLFMNPSVTGLQRLQGFYA